eukprot:gene32059-16592_t
MVPGSNSTIVGLVQELVSRCPTESPVRMQATEPRVRITACSQTFMQARDFAAAAADSFTDREPGSVTSSARRQVSSARRPEVTNLSPSLARGKSNAGDNDKAMRLGRCYAADPAPPGRAVYYDYYKATIGSAELMTAAGSTPGKRQNSMVVAVATLPPRSPLPPRPPGAGGASVTQPDSASRQAGRQYSPAVGPSPEHASKQNPSTGTGSVGIQSGGKHLPFASLDSMLSPKPVVDAARAAQTVMEDEEEDDDVPFALLFKSKARRAPAGDAKKRQSCPPPVEMGAAPLSCAPSKTIPHSCPPSTEKDTLPMSSPPAETIPQSKRNPGSVPIPHRDPEPSSEPVSPSDPIPPSDPQAASVRAAPVSNFPGSPDDNIPFALLFKSKSRKTHARDAKKRQSCPPPVKAGATPLRCAPSKTIPNSCPPSAEKDTSPMSSPPAKAIPHSEPQAEAGGAVPVSSSPCSPDDDLPLNRLTTRSPGPVKCGRGRPRKTSTSGAHGPKSLDKAGVPAASAATATAGPTPKRKSLKKAVVPAAATAIPAPVQLLATPAKSGPGSKHKSSRKPKLGSLKKIYSATKQDFPAAAAAAAQSTTSSISGSKRKAPASASPSFASKLVGTRGREDLHSSPPLRSGVALFDLDALKPSPAPKGVQDSIPSPAREADSDSVANVSKTPGKAQRLRSNFPNESLVYRGMVCQRPPADPSPAHEFMDAAVFVRPISRKDPLEEKQTLVHPCLVDALDAAVVETASAAGLPHSRGGVAPPEGPEQDEPCVEKPTCGAVASVSVDGYAAAALLGTRRGVVPPEGPQENQPWVEKLTCGAVVSVSVEGNAASDQPQSYIPGLSSSPSSLVPPASKRQRRVQEEQQEGGCLPKSDSAPVSSMEPTTASVAAPKEAKIEAAAALRASTPTSLQPARRHPLGSTSPAVDAAFAKRRKGSTSVTLPTKQPLKEVSKSTSAAGSLSRKGRGAEMVRAAQAALSVPTSSNAVSGEPSQPVQLYKQYSSQQYLQAVQAVQSTAQAVQSTAQAGQPVQQAGQSTPSGRLAQASPQFPTIAEHTPLHAVVPSISPNRTAPSKELVPPTSGPTVPSPPCRTVGGGTPWPADCKSSEPFHLPLSSTIPQSTPRQPPRVNPIALQPFDPSAVPAILNLNPAVASTPVSVLLVQRSAARHPVHSLARISDLECEEELESSQPDPPPTEPHTVATDMEVDTCDKAKVDTCVPASECVEDQAVAEAELEARVAMPAKSKDTDKIAAVAGAGTMAGAASGVHKLVVAKQSTLSASELDARGETGATISGNVHAEEGGPHEAMDVDPQTDTEHEELSRAASGSANSSAKGDGKEQDSTVQIVGTAANHASMADHPQTAINATAVGNTIAGSSTGCAASGGGSANPSSAASTAALPPMPNPSSAASTAAPPPMPNPFERRKKQQAIVAAASRSISYSNGSNNASFRPSGAGQKLNWLQPAPSASRVPSPMRMMGTGLQPASSASRIPSPMRMMGAGGDQPTPKIRPQLFQRPGAQNGIPKLRAVKAGACVAASYTLEQELRDNFINCQLANEWHNNKSPWARTDIAGLETGLTPYITQFNRLENCRKKICTYRGPESTAALQQRLDKEWAHLKVLREDSLARAAARRTSMSDAKPIVPLLLSTLMIPSGVNASDASLAPAHDQSTETAHAESVGQGTGPSMEEGKESMGMCAEAAAPSLNAATANAGPLVSPCPSKVQQRDDAGTANAAPLVSPCPSKVQQRNDAGNDAGTASAAPLVFPCPSKVQSRNDVWATTPTSILRQYEASMSRSRCATSKAVTFASVLELGPQTGYRVPMPLQGAYEPSISRRRCAASEAVTFAFVLELDLQTGGHRVA